MSKSAPTFKCVRKCASEIRGDSGHFEARLLSGCVAPEPAEHVKAFETAVIKFLWVENLWHPCAGLSRGLETSRHHPDHGARPPVQQDCSADHIWVTPKTLAPDTVAQDNHRVGSGAEMFRN